MCGVFLMNSKFYKILRKYIKKIITCNLGNVVELNNKLICYVDKRKLKKINFVFYIKCFGIGKEKNILTKEDDCKVNINVAKSELDIKRKQVVEVLREIRNNCIKRNEETIIKCQKQLNAKIIRKLLRNK